MNATGEIGVKAQVCTLYRARFICHENNFKPVKHDKISKQLEVSMAALNEETKFMRFLLLDYWPKEKDAILSNLLHTTLLDSEIEKNMRKQDILPVLVECYQRHFPIIAAQKIAKHKLSTINCNESSETEPSIER